MIRSLVLSLLFCCSIPAMAAPFEVAVTPSRFELEAKGPVRLGRSLDLYNVGDSATEVAVRTLDWSYNEAGDVGFHDDLQPGSCRPWVSLERKLVRIAPHSKTAFRFQVDVPVDAGKRECRLMLAFEGVDPATRALISQGAVSLSLPVNGRIAVAVYLMLNGAEPKLSMSNIALTEIAGRRVPAITLTNTGDAHGRVEGSLDATDSKGARFEMVPEGTPVLPGQTRRLQISPKADAAGVTPVPSYPLRVAGTLDWEKGAFRVNAELK